MRLIAKSVLCVALTLTVAGCQQEDPATQAPLPQSKATETKANAGLNDREEVEKYLKISNPIVTNINVLAQEYITKYVENKNEEEAFLYVDKVYLPLYSEEFEKAQNAMIEHKGLKQLHDKLIDSMMFESDAVLKDIEYRRYGNEANLKESKELFEKASLLSSDYNAQVTQLMKEYEIVFSE